MPLAFASLGSGSKGNGTLVRAGDCLLLVDCGFSLRETERRLAQLNCCGDDISAVLVTHEHSDHWRGVAPLARKFGLPVYMTAGTALAVKIAPEGMRPIHPQRVFAHGAVEILPVAVPHDAREPVQFCFYYQGRKLGVLTDLGSVSANVLEHFSDCDGLLLEANHDTEMLARGPYPSFLKRRVGGDWGHLNNRQAAGLLSLVERRKIQALVLGHISEQNNHVDLVQREVTPWTEEVARTLYACQAEGFAWQEID